MADRLVGQEAGGQAEGNCTQGDHTGSCSPCTLDWLISVLSISLQQVETEPMRLKLILITPLVKITGSCTGANMGRRSKGTPESSYYVLSTNFLPLG